MQSEKLGLKLREMRKKHGYSLQKVGDLLGVSPQSISQYELNKRDIPSLILSSLMGIYRLKGQSMIEFLDDVKDIPEKEKQEFMRYYINSKSGGMQFSFFPDEMKNDKEVNAFIEKLINNGYLVQATEKAFRIQNEKNVFFLSANEVKELLKDVDNYLKARIQALEQKYKDKGTRGLW